MLKAAYNYVVFSKTWQYYWHFLTRLKTSWIIQLQGFCNTDKNRLLWAGLLLVHPCRFKRFSKVRVKADFHTKWILSEAKERLKRYLLQMFLLVFLSKNPFNLFFSTDVFLLTIYFLSLSTFSDSKKRKKEKTPQNGPLWKLVQMQIKQWVCSWFDLHEAGTFYHRCGGVLSGEIMQMLTEKKVRECPMNTLDNIASTWNQRSHCDGPKI